MKKKNIVLLAALLAMMLLLTACSGLDVVGKESITSFNKMLTAAGNKVVVDTQYNGWSVNAPDETTKFIISGDFTKSPMHDVMIETDLAPFLKAGLDITKLPEDMIVDGKLHVGTKITASTAAKVTASISGAFEQVVKLSRASIKYHADLDLYGVSAGNGNMFDWAKDMTTNKLDIVFALNPQPLIDAGVDPAKVQGWILGQVTTQDANGKDIKVDKFLKPFNLQ